MMSKTWKMHYKWRKHKDPRYDAAIITLRENIEFSYNIRPICMPGPIDNIQESTIVTVGGWGATFNKEKLVPLTKMKPFRVNMTVISPNECKVWNEHQKGVSAGINQKYVDIIL